MSLVVAAAHHVMDAAVVVVIVAECCCPLKFIVPVVAVSKLSRNELFGCKDCNWHFVEHSHHPEPVPAWLSRR